MKKTTQKKTGRRDLDHDVVVSELDRTLRVLRAYLRGHGRKTEFGHDVESLVRTVQTYRFILDSQV